MSSAGVRSSPSHAGTHEHLHRASTDAAVDAAIDALRARGERVTGARRAVLAVLAHTHEHVSADDVIGRLKSSHPVVHRATVYRTLDLLAERGVVSHVHTGGGATLYHLASAPAGHEHLHAHCRVCGEVVVVAADVLDAAAARIATQSDFIIQPNQSTLVGICGDCAAAGSHPGPDGPLA